MNVIEKYVKDNNKKTYLSGEDVNKLVEIVNADKKELIKYNDEFLGRDQIENLEDYVSILVENYNYDLTIKNQDIGEMLYYIYGCEFDLEINENGTLDLIDLQGVYLGGGYSNFETIESALGRLSGSYLYDYFGIEVL